MTVSSLKIALRRLLHQRAYSLLNIGGLGLALGCCMVIFLFVQRQLSFDCFHHNGERVARMVTELNMEGMTQIGGVPYPMADAVRREISLVEKAAMTENQDEVIISIGVPGAGNALKFKQKDDFVFVEPDLFDILDLPLISGSPAALREPNKAFLTEKTARKFYGSTDVVGRSFRALNQVDIQVAGVLRDMPLNTSYGNEVWVSWSTLQNLPEKKSLDSWANIRGGTHCFVRLAEGRTLADFQAALPALSQRHNHPEQADLFRYQAYSLPELHFDTRYGGAYEKRYLWALAMIGLFLLITAAFNFVNMATAQALTRMREVGIRKAVGSSKGQLFGQFLFETGILVSISLLVGLGFGRLLLPFLNNWTQETLALNYSDPVLFGFLALLGLVMTLLSGAYPGLVMSGFKPVQSLKGMPSEPQKGGFTLRRTLVVGQFVISQLLIVGAAIVTLQLKYARDSDWGFRPESVVNIPIPETAKGETLRQELSQIPGIEHVSLCNTAPASGSNNWAGVKYNHRENGESWLANYKSADNQYLETYGLKLLAGRNLQESDSIHSFLVNEALVKKLNLASAAEIVGKAISIGGTEGEIVGVVGDFHHESFVSSIPPITIQPNTGRYSLCALRLKPGHPEAVLESVKNVWNGLFPAYYYEQSFLDAELAEFYENELMIMRIVRLFAGIAVLVGCLGLYGLAAFMITRKTKEIGIRKTLGARTTSILWIFGREYFRLILIAFVLAMPAAYYIMNAWLQQYAYRITPGPGIFFIGLALTCLIVILTVGVQSLRAARANPVQSLRNTQ